MAAASSGEYFDYSPTGAEPSSGRSRPARAPGYAEANGIERIRGDFEVVARMAERGVQGDIEQDWADDGLNFGKTPVPNRCERVVTRLNGNHKEEDFTWPHPTN